MVRLSVAALVQRMKGFCAAKFPAVITYWWSVWGGRHDGDDAGERSRCKRIIGVDMLPERLAMAKQLGVMDHGYLATTEGLPQIIAELTHGGADVALDCSGNAAGRLLALQSTADWGRVVYIGETGKVEFEVSADLMHHQRRIIGSWVTSLFHMEKCAHDLTDWKLWPRNAITHRFSLEQAGDAYALMASGKCGKVVINFPD